MMQNYSFEFVTKYCKQGPHSECHGSWTGLGFIINCTCSCHRKKDKALAQVVDPEASALSITQPPKEVIHDDR
jgi:hypothetical protein